MQLPATDKTMRSTDFQVNATIFVAVVTAAILFCQALVAPEAVLLIVSTELLLGGFFLLLGALRCNKGGGPTWL